MITNIKGIVLLTAFLSVFIACEKALINPNPSSTNTASKTM